MTPKELRRLTLQLEIEHHLDAIEAAIGSGYKLTLICRYVANDGLDKDIVLTVDDGEKAIETIRRMMKRPAVGREIRN